MIRSRYKIADAIPSWMNVKPTTTMKAEYENAYAQCTLQNRLTARQVKTLKIQPGRLLMNLR